MGFFGIKRKSKIVDNDNFLYKGEKFSYNLPAQEGDKVVYRENGVVKCGHLVDTPNRESSRVSVQQSDGSTSTIHYNQIVGVRKL